MADAKPGTWVDTKTGKVVTKQPEEGVQLVSPDAVEITPDHQRAVDDARTAAEGGDVEVATVDTKTVGKRSRKTVGKRSSR